MRPRRESRRGLIAFMQARWLAVVSCADEYGIVRLQSVAVVVSVVLVNGLAVKIVEDGAEHAHWQTVDQLELCLRQPTVGLTVLEHQDHVAGDDSKSERIDSRAERRAVNDDHVKTWLDGSHQRVHGLRRE